MRYSEASNRYLGQPMFDLLARAKEAERNGRDMVHFELGDPDIDTPDNVKSAAVKAILGNKSHYLPSRGLHELLCAAQEVTERSRGFRPDHEQLLVTPGANAQIYLALAVLCDAGSEVIIPRPYFPSYIAQIMALGCVPVEVETTEENGYQLRAEDVAAAVTSKTRAIIVNSPSNPTGAVYSQKTLEDLYEVARDFDIALISDEVYSRSIFTGERFFSPSMLDRCRWRVVVVNGFSKSFAMTGWRLGVMTGPRKLIERARLLLETIMSCVATPVQWAGVAALSGDQTEAQLHHIVYKHRRDTMCAFMDSIAHLRYFMPQGGLYVLAHVPDGMTEDEYVEWAFGRGVVVSPGRIFGAPGRIRFCYAGAMHDITKGMGRLAR